MLRIVGSDIHDRAVRSQTQIYHGRCPAGHAGDVEVSTLGHGPQLINKTWWRRGTVPHGERRVILL